MARDWRWAASLALLAAGLIFRDALTRTMTLHMLGHIPLILLAGVLGGEACTLRDRAAMPGGRRAACVGHYARCNEYGVAGLLLASFVAAYWMIPRALDEVLVSPLLAAGKFASLYVAGMALSDSLRRSNVVVRLFFLGNFCWMTAIVGLLYQDIPQRLCNFYLLGDQEQAGRGLVAIAVLLPLVWLFGERRRIGGCRQKASGPLARRPEIKHSE